MTDRTTVFTHIPKRFAEGADDDGRRLKRVAWLRKATKKEDGERQKGLRAIADQMEACGPNKRGYTQWCRHAYCPHCNDVLRSWFNWTAPVALIRAAQSHDPGAVSFLSLITPGRLQLGSSPDHIVKRVAEIQRETVDSLEAAGLTFALGAFDISVNKRKGDNVRDNERVQPHLWLACVTTDLAAADSAIRDAFPSKKGNKRPVLKRLFDGNLKAYDYANKNDFYQRVARTEKPNPDDPTSKAADKQRYKELNIINPPHKYVLNDQAA